MGKELLISLAIVAGGALLVNNWLGKSPMTLRSTRGLVGVEASPTPGTKPADKAAEPRSTPQGGELCRTPNAQNLSRWTSPGTTNRSNWAPGHRQRMSSPLPGPIHRSRPRKP